MPQLKSKAIIIDALNTERRRLEQKLSELPPAVLLVNGVVGDWSIKDILAHLADWEAHMPVWIEAARRDQPVKEIEEGLPWKHYNEFNERIYQRHKDQSLEDVLAYFHETHRQFMTMVEAMPEDEMLQLSRYAFIGKGAVYSWLHSYANHDKWAKTHIVQWIKTHQGEPV